MIHELSVLKEKISESSLNQKTRSENLVFNTIPAAGVEPARPCGHWILISNIISFKSQKY